MSLFRIFRMRNIFEYYIKVHTNKALLAIPIAGTSYMLLMYLFVLSMFFLSSYIDPGIYPRGMCIVAFLCLIIVN